MTGGKGGRGGRERLTRRALQRARPELAGPLPDPDVGVGIVHLGIGAFHRAHQAVLTQQAMRAEPGQWGICGVSQRRRTVVDQLRPQDGLYTVVERFPAGDHLRVVGAVRRVLLAPEEPERVVALLAAPTTHIVSITVTEAGYHHDPRTGRLDTADTEVTGDLAGRPPCTVIGQLVRGLQARRDAGDGAPLTILSCDNLPDNGTLVRGLVDDFCARLPAAEGERLRSWIGEHTAFPSTVVDQIVPAATPADLEGVADSLGLADLGAVVAEPHRQWVIEDTFAGPRPAWDEAGVRFVRDVAPDQAVKLRLVNGSHSAMAYLGLLAGFETVADAASRPPVRAFVRALLTEELVPTLSRFGVTRSEDEVCQLLDRFAATRVRHRLTQIAAHGTRKLPQRLVEPAAELLAAGREPRLTCLALAGWMRFLRGNRDGGGPLPELDDGSAGLRAAVGGLAEPVQVVDTLLRTCPAFPPHLAGSEPFRELLTDSLARISADGVLPTLDRSPGRGGL